MKRASNFSSIFKDDFVEYVKFMVDNGREFRVETSILKAFDRFLCRENHGVINEEAVVRFVYSTVGLTAVQYQKRHRTVRNFAEYRALKGSGEQIAILPNVRTHSRLSPYLYTDDEIILMLQEAGKLTPLNSVRPRTYQTILGLLLCTGMRISEVLNLDCGDVDLETGTLHIRNTKFKKSRLIPVHATTLTVLKKYADRRTALFSKPQCAAFFLNNRSGRVSYSTFNSIFLKIVRTVGIRPHVGTGSRTHDLRHTFAVKRLSAWYDEGADMNVMLPVLSTYMGHAHFEDTIYYLHVSAELLAKGSKAFTLRGGSDE
jgi:integrase